MEHVASVLEPIARRSRAGRPRLPVRGRPGALGVRAIPPPRRALAAVGLVLALAACGDSGRSATGVVISLDTTGGGVHGFTLRATDGAVLTFTIGDLDLTGAAFPASHLVEHAATADPVAVAYRVTYGQNVVYRLTDAAGEPASGSAAPGSPAASPSASP